VFLSTHEKQLDAKRRLLVPQDFRAAALTPVEGAEVFDGLYAFALKTLGCVECGGPEFFMHYKNIVEAHPFASPKRRLLERHIFGDMSRLGFDTAGRVTLPENLCEPCGLKDGVVLVGLYDRFQIWNPDAYAAYQAQQAGDGADLLAEYGL